jgi:hypothetical protein
MNIKAGQGFACRTVQQKTQQQQQQQQQEDKNNKHFD